MYAAPSPRALALREQVAAFMAAHVYPNETLYERAVRAQPGLHKYRVRKEE